MNSSINSNNLNFGAKVDLGNFAKKLKNPKEVKVAIEKATEKYPNDILDFRGNDEFLCIDYVSKEGTEQTIEFGSKAINKLLNRANESVSPFVKQMKTIFDTLRFGAKRQDKMDKLANKLIDDGFIKEDSLTFDAIISEGMDNTRELMYKKLAKANDEVLMSGKIY